MMDPLTYNEVHTRPALEEKLELIISATALVADSFCTRDDRRRRSSPSVTPSDRRCRTCSPSTCPT